MARWTVADIPSLTGRRAVVTGANSGLGFAVARGLAQAGAEVVLACRDPDKAAEARQRLHRTAPAATITVGRLDLADLSSVRAFATQFSTDHHGLDLLVNNAGVMAIPRRETVDGFELQFGTNHLGHFALTAQLLRHLLARPGSRVLTVSSEVARYGRIDFDDLQGRRRYGKWRAYAQAKLANQLFAVELDRRARRHGLDLTSVAAHPGYAATDLPQVGPRMSGSRLMERATRLGSSLLAQSAADGALPLLYGATAPGVVGGQYFGPDGFLHMRGGPEPVPLVAGHATPRRPAACGSAPRTSPGPAARHWTMMGPDARAASRAAAGGRLRWGERAKGRYRWGM